MDIQAILDDWYKNRLTHGQIKDKYNLSDEAECAITEHSKGLDKYQIENRLANVKPNMKWDEIKETMQGR